MVSYRHVVGGVDVGNPTRPWGTCHRQERPYSLHKTIALACNPGLSHTTQRIKPSHLQQRRDVSAPKVSSGASAASWMALIFTTHGWKVCNVEAEGVVYFLSFPYRVMACPPRPLSALNETENRTSSTSRLNFAPKVSPSDC